MEKWSIRGDWRNAACALLAFAVYSIPWLVLQVAFPLYVAEGKQRLPAPAVTLGIGLVGSAVLFILLVFGVPRLLARAGRDELAWRWRGGALHAAWFALAVTAIHVGLRLPLPAGLQVTVTVALAVAFAYVLLRLRA